MVAPIEAPFTLLQIPIEIVTFVTFPLKQSHLQGERLV